jgi:hypothetical protein
MSKTKQVKGKGAKEPVYRQERRNSRNEATGLGIGWGDWLGPKGERAEERKKIDVFQARRGRSRRVRKGKWWRKGKTGEEKRVRGGNQRKREGEASETRQREREGHKWEGTDPSVREREDRNWKGREERERGERRERVGVLKMDLMKREREFLEGTRSFVAAIYGRWCDKFQFSNHIWLLTLVICLFIVVYLHIFL